MDALKTDVARPTYPAWWPRSRKAGMDAERDRQRIDKWLWFARVVKSRTLAARLVMDGHVRVNGKRIAAAARTVAVGDVLTVALERQVRILRVVATGERRGPFAEASRLFEDLGDPVALPSGG